MELFKLQLLSSLHALLGELRGIRLGCTVGIQMQLNLAANEIFPWSSLAYIVQRSEVYAVHMDGYNFQQVDK